MYWFTVRIYRAAQKDVYIPRPNIIHALDISNSIKWDEN